MTEVEPFYVGFGLKVRTLRTARKMKQDDLAKSVVPPLTRAAIANIEGGKQRVRAHTLWEIARVLGVSPVELVPNEEDEKKRLTRVRTIEKQLGKMIPELPPERLSELSRRAVNSVTTRGARKKVEGKG